MGSKMSRIEPTRFILIRLSSTFRVYMSVLQVLTFPDERLRTVAKPVEKVTPEIQKFVDDMIETMYDEEGIGLAATQVDFHQRIVVIDISETRDQPMVLINPEILDKRGEDGIEEGCLSVPGARALVSRAAEVTVKALDRDGKEYTFEADDLLAICVQHELDHLEGKLFVDYLSPLKRKRIQDKLAKIKRFNEKHASQA
ncbi:peptide deformylase [Vibrio coralliilyticus]|uniref:Peptide deformylase n=2 Tax=Vibrio coralliilyticus TaxID=190893 RepID=A0AAP6ZNX9_9VIBR|nr:peptide deformylase [Vibrio coralliilyticus]NOH56182.1 peptide deformylase [Vibrio coralliilyticus]NOI60795.1 peptide deformylase [Vibrio coralliilyticus]NOJ25444.1 peptide deformylase [Vibrio coralliilyticus]PAT65325.1 peptide deformylase [Vibrio coralliilyticus]